MAVLRFLAGFALLATLCACVGQGPDPLPATAKRPEAIIAIIASADIRRVNLDGHRETLTEASALAETNLADALARKLESLGLALRHASMTGQAMPAIRRAEVVLPTAAGMLAVSGRASQNTAPEIGDYSVGTLADFLPCEGHEAADEPVLLIVHWADWNSAGHRAAQVALSAAMVAPAWPRSGASSTQAALADCSTGNLTWIASLDGGDARAPQQAAQLVDLLLIDAAWGDP